MGIIDQIVGRDGGIVHLCDIDVDRGEAIGAAAIGDGVGQGNRTIEVAERIEGVVAVGGDRHRADLGPATRTIVALAIDIESAAVGGVMLSVSGRVLIADILDGNRQRVVVQDFRCVDVRVVGEEVTGLQARLRVADVIEGDPAIITTIRVDDINGDRATDKGCQISLGDDHLIAPGVSTTCKALRKQEVTRIGITDNHARPTVVRSRGQDFGFRIRSVSGVTAAALSIHGDITGPKHEGLGTDP